MPKPKIRRIVPVLLRPRRKRAAGFVNLVVFDGQGNIVRQVSHRVRRATEALARRLAAREKRDLEAKGFQVGVDEIVEKRLDE